jgi:hypothetical protein
MYAMQAPTPAHHDGPGMEEIIVHVRGIQPAGSEELFMKVEGRAFLRVEIEVADVGRYLAGHEPAEGAEKDLHRLRRHGVSPRMSFL